MGSLRASAWASPHHDMAGEVRPNDRDTLALAVEIGFALRRIGQCEEALQLDAETLKEL